MFLNWWVAFNFLVWWATDVIGLWSYRWVNATNPSTPFRHSMCLVLSHSQSGTNSLIHHQQLKFFPIVFLQFVDFNEDPFRLGELSEILRGEILEIAGQIRDLGCWERRVRFEQMQRHLFRVIWSRTPYGPQRENCC